MHQQSTDPATEVKRLERCTNDLISVLALPAVWSVSEPGRILETLLDALMGILDFDFLYARVPIDPHLAPFDALKIARLSGTSCSREEIKQALNHWLGEDPQQWPEAELRHLADREFSVFPLRMGIEGELGLIVAGSQRAGFPEQTESLVLSVAANQAAIGLQQALRLNEQKRLATELDRRVAQRTAELATANEVLRKEIAERKEIENRLRDSEMLLKKSEARLWRVIDTIPTLVWSMFPDGSNELLSKRWHEYTGLSPEQSHGWGWQVAFHAEDLPPLLKRWQELLVSGEPGEIEARLRRYDGIYRWFLIRVSPFCDETGTILRWYGTSTDIDDRKGAEEALRERELDLLEITETIPEMLWSASPDGAIDYCNGRLLDYTGSRPEDVMSDGWINLLHPGDVEPTTKIWNACVKSGSPYRVEVRMYHVVGQTYRWCMTSALPLLDQEGRIVRWHGTVVDMHDWRQAQEELRNTQAELGRIVRVMTVGQLTASIAHEVSQPLSGIITNASTCLRMLSSEPPNVDGARETAQRTIRDGNRAADMITRLRTLFSKKEFRIERVDVNEAAREVIALLSDELQKNRVMVQPKFNDGLPPVKGDRVQLQQVLLNLLRNGSDAMVMVDDRPRQLLIRTDADASHVTVFVQDSGVGFDPEMTDRLFHTFFTTKQDGMGIGLSLCRSIVEAHSGHLWATRNDGPGATFAFSIPRDSGLPLDTAS